MERRLTNVAKVAVVGAGGIGLTAHLPAVAALADTDLVAIVDVDAARLAMAGAAYPDVGLYGSLGACLADREVDIVCIATPPHLHEELAIEAMRAGCWTLVEKPMTGSLGSVDRIIAAEQETGCWSVSVAQFRYAGGSRAMRDALAAGTWGRPLLASVQTSWFRGPDYWREPWRGRYATELGGCTTTQGFHAMDLTCWLLGARWTEVMAFTATLDRPIEVEDASVACVRFDSGALASMLATVLSHNPRTTVQIFAQDGTVRLDTLYLPETHQWQVHPSSVPEPPTPVPELVEGPSLTPVTEPAHQAQLRALVTAWQRNVQPELTAGEARTGLELLSALYKSADTGRAVRAGEIIPGDPYYDALAGPRGSGH